MRKTNLLRALSILFFLSISNISFAGGRYEDPPDGLVEVYGLSQQILQALDAGDNAKALEIVKQARKIALDSYKEKSSMPMQIASSGMKEARNALEANPADVAKAKQEVQHAYEKLSSEIEYYKKEGKIK
ncbi:hypothetical protein F6R98_11075 [Candidatus Methylospira mobilis]|uniref:DUF4398 domain-containing protein n=1 Tax=Candidatus Methylospira mobilis TaxID=1808979 RepID=A0A5Q0BGV2_9GAMM|nr:hypothetical protein [Candidatus Methylospira mobilis]QFY43095.1 hypothetical protein F6R98_11075 [Candidatus Methylospira mobilis]WNV03761.1 hypothetical protein RP726_15145 [Candidatus Methylospira mobilis]